MMQPQTVSDPGIDVARDPWSSWAKVVDAQAPDEPEAEPALVDEPADATVDVPPEATVEAPAPPAPPDNLELAPVVAQLAAELADERRQRTIADEARREAEVAVARISAEVTAARARIAELERDRDEVIRRAEELLTAVRERADQRLASELDGARRHWSELLAQERQRAEALDGERTALARRVEDAWLAAAVLRSARPLRLRASEASMPAEAEEEVLEALEEYEVDPTFAAEVPKLTNEIEQLRQRLRSEVHKPADIDTVEDGVEDLRVLRLARETESKGRRRK